MKILYFQHYLPRSKMNSQAYQLLEYASQGSKYVSIMREASELYSIQRLKLESLTPKHIKESINERLEEMQNKKRSHNIKGLPYWAHFEFKTFVWIAICYGSMTDKDLDHFDNQDIEFLNRMFPNRAKEFLMYQLLSLNKMSINQTRWTEEENKLLVQAIRDSSSQRKNPSQKYQWSQISFALFVGSGCSIFRPREKCREQWVNHLDPGLRRSKWGLEEDILLFRLVVKYGKKWSLLSKLFEGHRNEHMVKNRYNSLINKFKKTNHKNVTQNFEQRILRQLEQIQGEARTETTPEPNPISLTEETPISLTEEAPISLAEEAPPCIENEERQNELYVEGGSVNAMDVLLQLGSKYKLDSDFILQPQESLQLSFLEESCFYIRKDPFYPFLI